MADHLSVAPLPIVRTPRRPTPPREYFDIPDSDGEEAVDNRNTAAFSPNPQPQDGSPRDAFDAAVVGQQPPVIALPRRRLTLELAHGASSDPEPPSEAHAVEPRKPRELVQDVPHNPSSGLGQVAPCQSPAPCEATLCQPPALDQVAPGIKLDDVAPHQSPELVAVMDQCAREIKMLLGERDACVGAVLLQDRFVAEFRAGFPRTVAAVILCIAKLEAASTMAEVISALQAATRELANIPSLPDKPRSTEDAPSAWVQTRNAAVNAAVARVEATLGETRPAAEDCAMMLVARVSAFMRTNTAKRVVADSPAERESLWAAVQQLQGALMWKVVDMCDASPDVLAPLGALREQFTEQGKHVRERNDDILDELRQASRSQPSAERNCVHPSAHATCERSPEPLAQADALPMSHSTSRSPTPADELIYHESEARRDSDDDVDSQPQPGLLYGLYKRIFKRTTDAK